MVFGSGGALLQKLNRDTFKCSTAGFFEVLLELKQFSLCVFGLCRLNKMFRFLALIRGN